jgi:hypothetical protein
VFGVMHAPSWFQRGIPVNLRNDWRARTSDNNYEAALTFLWASWCFTDLGLCYASGFKSRLELRHNWRMALISLGLFTVNIVLIFSKSSFFSCMFKVNCDAAVYDQLVAAMYGIVSLRPVDTSSWNSSLSSTVFPLSWQFFTFSMFVLMSISHHLGYQWIVRHEQPKLLQLALRLPLNMKEQAERLLNTRILLLEDDDESRGSIFGRATRATTRMFGRPSFLNRN